MTKRLQDRQMEQVYRLVPIVGHRRAIREVAGNRYDSASLSLVPNVRLQQELLARFNIEMGALARSGY